MGIAHFIATRRETCAERLTVKTRLKLTFTHLIKKIERKRPSQHQDNEASYECFSNDAAVDSSEPIFLNVSGGDAYDAYFDF